jgi:hypothetical protein
MCRFFFFRPRSSKESINNHWQVLSINSSTFNI